MKSIVTLLAFAAALPAWAQDRDVERLKEEQGKALRQLEQRFQAERARIQKEFESRLQASKKRPADRGDAPPAIQRLASAVSGLLKRVEALEKRLTRIESALRQRPTERKDERKKGPPKRDRGF